MPKKILLIDDNPDQELSYHGEDKQLQEILNDLFGDKYELMIEEDPDLGPSLVANDNEIEVVLLDVSFGGDLYGKVVAKKIYEVSKKVKIVALSVIDERGTKGQLGRIRNVWTYFVKEKISEANGPEVLKGIVTGLIEDPYNELWSIELDYANESAVLYHQVDGEMGTLDLRSSDQLNTLDCCLEEPNECFHIDEIEERSDGYQLGRVVSALNNKLLKAASYKTWGFIDSRRCPRNKVKIVIGERNESAQQLSPPLASQFEEMQKELIEIKQRLAALENKI